MTSDQETSNSYELFEVKISVECGNDAYGWSVEVSQCVVECDSQGTARRAKGELYKCECDGGYSWNED